MGEIFRTKDPRGIEVYCTETDWNGHTVFGPTGHPIMKDNVAAIIETIESPEYIFESKDSDPPLDYREVYSKKVSTATYYETVPYTKVVVSVLGGSGEMVTAFPAKDPRGGTKGEPIYDANNGN